MFSKLNNSIPTSGELLAQCLTNLSRAVEVATDRRLLKIVASNSFGIPALICAHGDKPEFAAAILTNEDILYDSCDDEKRELFVNLVLDTYEKAFVNKPSTANQS